MNLRRLGEAIKSAATKPLKPRPWLGEFFITFICFVLADALHQLRLAGQPIRGLIFDGFGLAAFTSAITYFIRSGSKTN